MNTILIIEDDPVLNKAYTEKLSDEFNLIRTNSGAQGLSLALSQKPDIIILDLILPGDDGISILKRLKETPETAAIPVLIITNLDNQKEVALRMGAAAYLVKANIDMHIVLDTVNQFKNSRSS